MSLNPRLVKESFALVEPVAAKAAAYFYGRLFAQCPHLRGMFPPALNAQRDRLFDALTRVVWSLDSPDGLATYLRQLGRDHRKYGVVPEHYAAVGDALLATVRRFAAAGWTPEVEAAWAAAYQEASRLMIEAAEEDAGVSPAWWLAEVVDHERRTDDIAVVTLRPSQPFPFTAGQYVNVQTTHWPRVWRPFSVANAPRPDNTLRLHVRAIPGGWVSNALTRHTRVGDTLMLGPAIGAMAPPSGSGRDVLAVAGGTGLAPLKAIVEHVLASAPRPGVHLLYGARRAGDLYDLPDLLRMQAEQPRLTVRPVVSGDDGGPGDLSDLGGHDGMRGTLPEVLGRFRSWQECDAYVCGPAAMVTATVRRLQQEGVPPERIHYDPVRGG